MESTATSQSTRPTSFSISTRGALLLIVLISIVLRVWGLDFGLPQTFHPDEPVIVTHALYGVATNDWSPPGFHWPSLQLYLLGVEYEAWFFFGKAMEYWEYGDPDFISYSLHSPGGFYYLGRLTTVLFGAGCVWLTFLLARRFLREPGALAAAAMVAVNPIMTRHSRFITPDIPSELFFLAALLFIDSLNASLSKKDDQPAGRYFFVRYGIYAAIMVGLGAGTKYLVGLLGIPMVLTALFTQSKLAGPKRVALALGLGLVSILVFLVTTPFAILNWNKFVEDIRTISWHVHTGHIGMEAAGGIWLASLRQFLNDSGWVWVVASLTGMIFVLLRHPKRTWPVILALIIALAGLAPLNVFSDRYLVPLIPFAAMGIGWWIDLILAPAQTRRSIKPALAVVATIVFLAVIANGALVLGHDAYTLTLPDTRELALDWVQKNIPTGSRILVEQGGPDLNDAGLAPLVPEPYYEITEITPLFTRLGEELDPLDRIVQARPDWVITSSEVRNRYMRPGEADEYPDLVAVFTEYYRLVENHLTEVERFAPGAGLTGPQLVIYRVPDGFWERVRLGETTVQNVLNAEAVNHSDGE